MNPLGRRRLTAYALDAAGYAGIAAATIPLGLLAARAGLGESWPFVLSASVVPVAVATAVATYAEARGGTWGKRVCGLTVERVGGGPLSFNGAFRRNLVKIAIPWQLGHIVAIGGAFGGFNRPEPSLLAASALTYGVIGVGIWGVLRSSGISLHDIIGHSRVIEAGRP
jgi:uncharacterized RDD family membrane protein YckC